MGFTCSLKYGGPGPFRPPPPEEDNNNAGHYELDVNPDNYKARLEAAFAPQGQPCPKCQSTNTEGDLGVMGPGGSTFEWICRACNHTWNEHSGMAGIVLHMNERDS